jgi:hypothetical protein
LREIIFGYLQIILSDCHSLRSGAPILVGNGEFRLFSVLIFGRFLQNDSLVFYSAHSQTCMSVSCVSGVVECDLRGISLLCGFADFPFFSVAFHS